MKYIDQLCETCKDALEVNALRLLCFTIMKKSWLCEPCTQKMVKVVQAYDQMCKEEKNQAMEIAK